ncbi:unnamed protein product [Lupinus luteus]|uniref:Uncharacterized protein n=1 Tax=Lupinus luteus TaxID=3873 RepID=A0AAV1VX70_LUPLU
MEREHQKTSLNSPLIQNLEQDGSIVDVEKSKSSAIRRTEILEEVRKQLWLAGPLIIVNLLNFSLQVISVMFVGHLGELALSGTSMANSFASVTGFTFLRAMFSLMIVSIPIAIIWANTRSILIFLGQDPEISIEAGKLAIPSALMVCLELWSFEMVVLLSGLLPNPKLETSVLSICLNTVGIVWMIPLGFGGAVSTRVSNELGAGHPQAASLAVSVVLVMVLVEAIIVGAGE